MAIKVKIDDTGMNLMRSPGRQLRVMPAFIDFSEVTDYPTGGVEADFSSYFAKEVVTVTFPNVVANDSGTGDYLILEYDEDNEKVKVIDSDDGNEVAGNHDVSSLGDVRCIVYGY